MKTCTESACGKPMKARGLCSTHYNRKYQPDRWKPKTAPCAYCGKAVTKVIHSGRKHGAVCSNWCRAYLQALSRRGDMPSAGRELVHLPPPPRKALVDDRPRPATPLRKRWFAGTCGICGTTFVSQATATTCSDACAEQRYMDRRRADKHARRARERAAFVAYVYPRAIYRRDGWQCWLCQGAIDPHADPQGEHGPSLDHVIPLANGGTHEPANVRAAHRGCNARRSNHPTLTNREGERVAVLF